MTEEQIRIAIAESQGWTACLATNAGTFGNSPKGGYEQTPDYLRDLNAMHEAFKSLGRHWEICQVGDGYICRIQFGPKNRDVSVGGLELLEVMSEAFLRTLGKWVD